MNEDNEQEIIPEDEPISPPPGFKKILYKGRKAGKNAIKSLGNEISLGIKSIWIALPSIAKIVVICIIIFVVLCASAITVLASYSVKKTNNVVDNYILGLSDSSIGSKMYTNTASLLLIKDEQISEIEEQYLEELIRTDTNLYSLMSKKYGVNSVSEEEAVSSDEQKTLYNHFLNTEKYNFNKINWVKYERGVEAGNPDMKVDAETRLQYPIDIQNTSLESLAKKLQPYLQNYLIPYSLYSGLITDGGLKSNSDEQQLTFGYEMVNNIYHDIQVNQYNMESYIKVTSENVYDVMSVNVQHSVTYKNGAIVKNGKKKVSTSVETSCVHDKVQIINEETKQYVKYRVKYAKLFDKYIINEYKYTEYNLNNEPDDQTISRTVYKDDNYKKYEEGTYDIPSSAYNLKYDENGNVMDGTYIANYTFKAKKGYTDTTTSTWKDILEPVSHEERAYTVDDIEEELTGEKLSYSERKYYEKYEYSDSSDESIERLNLFDIANSKKEIFNNYLRENEAYSKNIGYNRTYMTYSFYALKQAIKEISSLECGWKYFYGSSLGAKEVTTSNISTSSSYTELTDVDYSSLPEGKLGWPSPGNYTISSYFGARSGGTHKGIDISMPIGSTFVAAAAGTVVKVQSGCTDNYKKANSVADLGKPADYCGGGAGNYVMIQVDNSETYLYYMHMTEVTVSKDQHVEAGQAIGTSGTTGRSTGPHAHFEVRVGGTSSKYAVDPCNLFDMDYCND